MAGSPAIVAYQLLLSSFLEGRGLAGLAAHVVQEWVIIANLACLLLGFAIRSRHFEKSHVPLALLTLLPDDWKGCFALLAIVFVLSPFLDNIAAAMIGGAMAHTLFKKVSAAALAAARPSRSAMSRNKPSAKTKPRLPRAPLPKQTGGAHEDKSKRVFRKEKHKKKWRDE